MIEKIIEASAKNKFLVFLMVIFLSAWGLWALKNTPLDAIPDLSDVQVIVYTPWMGRNPTIMEDQVTYPIVTAMISGTEGKIRARLFRLRLLLRLHYFRRRHRHLLGEKPRSRIHESGAEYDFPRGVTPTLGPDASGVGWVFQYALIDESEQA